MFKTFAKAINTKFNSMSSSILFLVDVDKDKLWDTYLAAYPEGTNPIYKTNTTHDCNCCKQFIVNLGLAVTSKDGVLDSVWNVPDLEEPYKTVAAALHALVVSGKIISVFTCSEPKYGAETTRQLTEDGTVINWNHFHAVVPASITGPTYRETRGSLNMRKQTLESSLTLSLEAAETVLGLINMNELYRGEEHKSHLEMFISDKKKTKHDNWCWENLYSSTSGFKNSVIGTLVQDISDGKSLEASVASFEKKVAPDNYKRPNPVVSQSMIDDAMKTADELGLKDALERRLANISDITVNNVIWANAGTANQMKPTLLKPTKVAKGGYKKDITIEDFIANVLPKAATVELLLKNQHKTSLMTLTTAMHEGAGKLFKWGNPFGWSYAGNMADSIKERVKLAGGNVNAKLRVSISWKNFDDLDIHAGCPEGHVFYGDKCGILDVDMNSPMSTKTRTPVENLAWVNPRDGEYAIDVSQYLMRETSDTGYTIEMENNGEIKQWSSTYSPKSGTAHPALRFVVKDGVATIIEVGAHLTEGCLSEQVWGVETETYVPVTTVLNSPNHWDGECVGNKHYFFILEGCKTDTKARGIYNEFLRSDLDKHRKVFELLGDVRKCELTDNQLSGVGFSETSKTTVTVKVTTGEGIHVLQVGVKSDPSI